MDNFKVLDNLNIEEKFDQSLDRVSSFNDFFESKIGSSDFVYGDVAKFAVEVLPGVQEYKAIKEGDWMGFAIALTLDIVTYVAFPVGASSVVATKIAPEIGEVVVKKVVAETLENTSEEIVEKAVSKYSVEIIDAAINNPEQIKIFEKLGLKEMVINDKKVLINEAIDHDLKSFRKVDGLDVLTTNLERMKLGLAPIGDDGNPFELHHIGQKMDSPLAQLTKATHLGNYSLLHDQSMPSQIDRKLFRQEKVEHWKQYAKVIEGES